MADIVVLRLFLEKSITILANEASLIGNVRGELEEMKNELESMRGFLVDADQMTVQRENENIWVENVRDMVYDVEDLIDLFFYHVNKPPAGDDGTLARAVYRTIRLPKTLLFKDRIARQLQEYNKKIKSAIPDRMRRYSFERPTGNLGQNSGRGMTINLQEGAIYTKEDDLIGIEKSKEKLKSLLTMETNVQRIVIPVTGMGGVGKSTLVRKVYEGLQVTKSFTSYAWVNVSQNYYIDDLLRKIVKELFKAGKELKRAKLKDMSYKELVETLVNLLEHKKYVVVLDDVWDVNLWDQLKVALPHGTHGSRVLLTTRDQAIADAPYGIESHVHRIDPLHNGEAWTLFCKKAFPLIEDNICPPEFEPFVTEFMKTCGGLPLAILALGGFISTKKTKEEWNQVSVSMQWHLENKPQLKAAKSILWLSYIDLPYRLKQCFLYFCLFPSGYNIRRRKIIRLWIAEGFIEQVANLTPEEVGAGYLTELVSRSMIQVLRRLTSGVPEVFKVHDFLREIALSMKETNKFCVVHVGGNNLEECGARRLSVQSRHEDMSSCKGISKLRSFFVFSKFSLNPLFHQFRMLRVLDLKDGDIKELPDGVGELFNLRYLNLKRTKIKELPKAIGRLRNLLTLDIRDTPIEILPAGIAKMRDLRHLIMYNYNYQYLKEFEYVCGKLAPLNICKLTNLQALMGIRADGNILKQIGCLTQLRRLAITNLGEDDEGDMCNSIKNMTQLRFLLVMAKNEKQPLQMNALKRPPPYLDTLNLVGKMDKIPKWFPALENLVSLYLHWSRLDTDLLLSVQDLPNLGRLILVKAYNGRRLKFLKGFKKLIVLHMELDELNEIIIADGVMPKLEQLNVANCPNLSSPIVGIGHLANLRKSYIANHPLSKFQGSTIASTSYAK